MPMPSFNPFNACQQFCGEKGTNFDVTNDADISFPEELERQEQKREEVVDPSVEDVPPTLMADQINLAVDKDPEEVVRYLLKIQIGLLAYDLHTTIT